MKTALTDDAKRNIIIENGGKKENILGILLDLQYASPEGYIDRDTASFVGNALGMTETRVYEIASYYAMIQVKPQAAYVLEVCNSSPCYFSKSEEIMDILKRELKVNIGEATPDGMFMLHYTPCVGACDIGPVIKIRDRVYGNLNEEKVVQIIKDLRAGLASA